MGCHQVWKSSHQGEHFQSIAARKEKDVSGRANAKREWEELFLFIIYIIFIGGIFKTSFF